MPSQPKQRYPVFDEQAVAPVLQVKAAREQLVADYLAAEETFPMAKEVQYRMFCLGAAMCLLTVKGYLEDAAKRPLPSMTVEESLVALNTAAKLGISCNANPS